MSENFDGNTGWQVNEGGDVVPDGPSIDMPGNDTRPHDTYTDPLQEAAQKIDDNFDPSRGLSPEEARTLNSAAEQERGGRSVTPDPSKVRELPGKNGRPLNWKESA